MEKVDKDHYDWEKRGREGVIYFYLKLYFIVITVGSSIKIV